MAYGVASSDSVSKISKKLCNAGAVLSQALNPFAVSLIVCAPQAVIGEKDFLECVLR